MDLLQVGPERTRGEIAADIDEVPGQIPDSNAWRPGDHRASPTASAHGRRSRLAIRGSLVDLAVEFLLIPRGPGRVPAAHRLLQVILAAQKRPQDAQMGGA